MSDIHVLDAAETGDSIQVVFHFPVPDTDNDVSVNHRIALVASGKGGTTTMVEGTDPGQIATAERAAIEAGEVYEHVRAIKFSGVLTGPDLLTEVRSFYKRDKDDLTARLAVALKYFGFTAEES